MPRRRQPRTLYRACLIYVTVHMHVPRSENTSDISELPQTINEDIVVALQKGEAVDYTLLCHVLGNLLRFVFLNRRQPPTEQIASHIHSQLRRYGDQLTVLHLPLTEAQYDTFVTTLSSLPRLRSLVLHVNDLAESVAEAITRHCPNLIHLCFYGVRYANYLHEVITNEPTYVTQVAFHNVLSMLESLRLLTFRIRFLDQAVLSLPVTTRLLLRELKIYEDILETHDSLSHVITLCPNLRKVWLVFFNEIQIEPLSRLIFLEDLTIIILNRDFSLDFSDLIQQLLSYVGWRLKRLRLNVPVLDLTRLIRFCPALIELHVERLRHLVNYERSQTRSHQKLQALRIALVSPIALNSYQLCGLLQDYGRLARVFLHRCFIEDGDLRKLIFSGRLSKLEVLELAEVYGFIPGTLQLLLMAQNDLVIVRLIRCPSVSRADVEGLRALVWYSNLACGIEYAPHNDQRA